MALILSIVAFFCMSAGFIGLWIWMQKRVEITQKKLQEAFQSLSFEVMEKSGKTFLDLAKTSLEKYQDGAKTDLENRQKAIEASLIPLKETMKLLDDHQTQ